MLIYFCLSQIPGYFQGSRSQNKFQAFQGFQRAVGTLIVRSYRDLIVVTNTATRITNKAEYSHVLKYKKHY